MGFGVNSMRFDWIENEIWIRFDVGFDGINSERDFTGIQKRIWTGFSRDLNWIQSDIRNRLRRIWNDFRMGFRLDLEQDSDWI